MTETFMSHEAMSGSSRPLASFTVFAYNQERFIRDAIRGAFSQDYRPLQVILSDDASTDRTFEIMQEMASECPADIDLVLNRNEVNGRIAHHINKVIGLCKGEFIVLSAGDDISLPQRTQVSVEAIATDPYGRHVLHSTVSNMDADGNFIRIRENPHRHATDNPHDVLVRDVYLTGSSVTLRKKMYADFPGLQDDVVNEDKVTAFRCAFFGGAIYLDEPLVRYREGVGAATMGGAILSDREDPAKELRYMRMVFSRRASVLAQAWEDCHSPVLTSEVGPELLRVVQTLRRRVQRVMAFLDQPAVWRLPQLVAGAGFTRKTIKIAVLLLLPDLYRRYKLR